MEMINKAETGVDNMLTFGMAEWWPYIPKGGEAFVK